MQLLARPEEASSAEDHEFLECLVAGGFLIPNPVDQLATIQATAKKLRRLGSILGLTIAPTLACNFRCDYCFEARSNVRMTEPTQEALLRFCDRQLQRAEGLRVWWFGGEPTICMSILDRVQNGLLDLAAKHNAEIISGEIITNGYLLDGAMAKHLRDLHITKAKITIDGPQPIHDRRRKLANGQGSFWRIIDNLEESSTVLSINVRINIDRDNVESAYKVIDILKNRGILPRVKVHFGQVTSSGVTCADVRDRCLSTLDFSRARVEIYNRLHDRGIYIYEYPVMRAAGASCAALSEGYFTVGPDGYLYRCWEDMAAGAEKSIGTVFEPNPSNDKQREMLAKYRTWDPFKMSECRSCGILPVCMGGCPAASMETNEPQSGHCIPTKFHLGDFIALRYRCETQLKADS
ncbi:hypothetical protein C3F09_08030 [candidate division GN15 bacterium]|uniref:Radical SAM core domain-containing protein n=1 Tax=candidate division GN15 bacterium TaxID=2072418 RepID=A0A855X5R1_9BACT|nr:MAG: hypothetical protein C3F09_08030 [candidate division GN15 bacterium]